MSLEAAMTILGVPGAALGAVLRAARTHTRARRRFEALASHSSEVVTVVDAEGRIRYQSPAGQALLGWKSSEKVGRMTAEFVHPDDLERVREHFQTTLAQPGPVPPVTLRLRHADGSWRWVESHTDNLLEHPAVRGVVIHSRDVGDRKALEDELRHLAFHDPLTGLANRTLLVERLRHALAAGRREGARVALLVIDLDEFKAVNDRLGHVAGDDVLRAVGRRLAGLTRAGDTLARLGGDEFAVLVDRVVDPAAVIALAERIVAALREPIALGEAPIALTASVGVVVAEAARSEPELLLRNADAAMYLAKRGDRGYELYAADRDPHVGERLALAGELRRALAGEELDVHLQPIVELSTGRVLSVEALVRWQHPERGLLFPDSFLTVAEHSGQIHALTRRVLDRALDAVATLERAGHAVDVAVNLSPASLEDPALADDVAAALERSGIDGGRVGFEVTESLLLSDPARAAAVVERLAALGTGLSIDDFGTGHSSLTRLRQLPICELKIDRSFVEELGRSPDSSTIVRSTINLAHDLGMRVVAEGVETMSAWSELRALGCDRGQGYGICRPVPVDQLLEWMERWRSQRTTIGPAPPARKRGDQAMRETQEWFGEIFRSTPLPMSVVGLDGRFLRVNSALCALLARRECELLDLSFAEITVAEDRELSLGKMDALIAGDVPSTTMTKSYCRPDGSVVRARITIVVVRDGTGRPLHFLTQIMPLDAAALPPGDELTAAAG